MEIFFDIAHNEMKFGIENEDPVPLMPPGPFETLKKNSHEKEEKIPREKISFVDFFHTNKFFFKKEANFWMLISIPNLIPLWANVEKYFHVPVTVFC
jgi:hypothetical protein